MSWGYSSVLFLETILLRVYFQLLDKEPLWCFLKVLSPATFLKGKSSSGKGDGMGKVPTLSHPTLSMTWAGVSLPLTQRHNVVMLSNLYQRCSARTDINYPRGLWMRSGTHTQWLWGTAALRKAPESQWEESERSPPLPNCTSQRITPLPAFLTVFFEWEVSAKLSSSLRLRDLSLSFRWPFEDKSNLNSQSISEHKMRNQMLSNKQFTNVSKLPVPKV